MPPAAPNIHPPLRDPGLTFRRGPPPVRTGRPPRHNSASNGGAVPVDPEAGWGQVTSADGISPTISMNPMFPRVAYAAHSEQADSPKLYGSPRAGTVPYNRHEKHGEPTHAPAG